MSSRANRIREAIIDRLTGQLWLPVIGLRRTARPQLQDGELPALLVVIVDESQRPEDEANCGPPRFMTELTVGISYCVGYAPPEALDDTLDEATECIRRHLLTDPTFVRGVDPSKPIGDPDRDPLFEAVTKVRRGRLYPQDGAGYLGEGRLEITFAYRDYFDPVIPDELEAIEILGRPAPGDPNTTPVRLKIITPPAT